MEVFLEKLAKKLLKQHGKQIGDLCIVFPSKRAGVWFREHLSRQLKQPAFAPEILAFEEFILRIHPVTIADPLSLIFELFPIYHAHFPDEPFERFFTWAGQLIADFDEADRALTPINQLFGNLFELKKIDVTIDSWLNEDRKPTLSQANYLLFWEKMRLFYQELKEKLKEKGMAWPGMALREVAEQLSGQIPNLPWQRVVFAGFNALTPAERLLFESLRDWGKAEVWFDMDAWYVDQEEQEAGSFYRELRGRWGNWANNWVEKHLTTSKKDLLFTGVPKRVGQAKVAGLKVAELLEKGVRPDQIAVVLPEENLLFPLLHALPEEVTEINVTMGFPLRNTPLYSLCEALLRMQENASERDESQPGRRMFYFRDVLTVLFHPYVNTLAGEDARQLIQQVHADNLIYLSSKFFERFAEGHLFRFLFKPWEAPGEVAGFFMDLFLKIKEVLIDTEKEENEEEEEETEGKSPRPTVELEILFRFYTLAQKLQDKVALYYPDIDLKTYRRLFREVIQQTSLPFSGEPLGGLQIMGTLETRCLDFEYLIVLSLNEGILPSGKEGATFIPWTLRKSFGIPTYEEKDAVFAYHFYRLLQRAGNITLIYNTEEGKLGAGERSRFLAQIAIELIPANPKINFREEILTFPAEKEAVREISIPKTPALLDLMAEFLKENGLSPSGLATYLNCPLQFYFQYILRLYEESEAREFLEADTFGEVAHKALEELYKPFLGRMVGAGDIDGLRRGVPKAVRDAFREVTKSTNLRTGKNYLLVRVISDLVDRLLVQDLATVPFEILGLERRLETLSEFGGRMVKLKGIIDRVDRKDGTVRVIDYKTGSIKKFNLPEFSKVRERLKDFRAPLQLADYTWLYFRCSPESEEVIPGIYPLKALSEGVRDLELDWAGKGPYRAPDLQPFEDFLTELMGEIFDAEREIVQTEDEKNCTYCPYKVICQRQ